MQGVKHGPMASSVTTASEADVQGLSLYEAPPQGTTYGICKVGSAMAKQGLTKTCYLHVPFPIETDVHAADVSRYESKHGVDLSRGKALRALRHVVR